MGLIERSKPSEERGILRGLRSYRSRRDAPKGHGTGSKKKKKGKIVLVSESNKIFKLSFGGGGQREGSSLE